MDTIQMRENPELIHPKRDAIHVGLIGSLSVAKGAQVIKDCLSYIAENHLPIPNATVWMEISQRYTP